MTPRKAIYAFSADPIHYGHINIIERASQVFDEIIVGIGVNPAKTYLFELEDRLNMVRKALAHIPNIKVVTFTGLLVDYAYENGIQVIVKGIRTDSDVDYELMLHKVGESQKLGIDTFFLPCKQDMTHISSSSVKALQREQGLIHEYVPLNVKQRIEERIAKQYIVGITGEIGSGKSHLAKEFEKLGKIKGISVHNIELDDIGHEILGLLQESLYCNVRELIFKEFGEHLRLADGMVNRKNLGAIVFNDPERLNRLNKIMYTPLLVRLRRALYGKQGLILFNAALLAETQMLHLCNNNVVLVSVDKSEQEERLKKRGLTSEQIQRRLAGQYNTEEKKRQIEDQIARSNQGKLWINNNPNELFENIVQSLRIREER